MAINTVRCKIKSRNSKSKHIARKITGKPASRSIRFFASAANSNMLCTTRLISTLKPVQTLVLVMHRDLAIPQPDELQIPIFTVLLARDEFENNCLPANG